MFNVVFCCHLHFFFPFFYTIVEFFPWRKQKQNKLPTTTTATTTITTTTTTGATNTTYYYYHYYYLPTTNTNSQPKTAFVESSFSMLQKLLVKDRNLEVENAKEYVHDFTFQFLHFVVAELVANITLKRTFN